MSLLNDRPDRCSGLYQKYKVLRRDGKRPKGAEYFVLRIDRDDAHGHACRHAVRAYAKKIRKTLPEFAADLDLWISEFEP